MEIIFNLKRHIVYSSLENLLLWYEIKMTPLIYCCFQIQILLHVNNCSGPEIKIKTSILYLCYIYLCYIYNSIVFFVTAWLYILGFTFQIVSFILWGQKRTGCRFKPCSVCLSHFALWTSIVNWISWLLSNIRSIIHQLTTMRPGGQQIIWPGANANIWPVQDGENSNQTTTNTFHVSLVQEPS